jgi:hypothetical protein
VQKEISEKGKDKEREGEREWEHGTLDHNDRMTFSNIKPLQS